MTNNLNAKILKQVEEYTSAGESITLFPDYTVFAARGTTCPVTTLYEPMLCLVLQGSKEVTVGEKVFYYQPGDYFINSVELPIATRIIESEPDKPYISISIKLDADKLAQIITEIGGKAKAETNGECFGLYSATDEFLEPLSRLFDLLDNPEDTSFLAPMVEREILYRLLQSKQQSILRQIAGNDSRVNKVRDVINWVKEHYSETLKIAALTEQAGMSQASFHRHFRSATGMTPLQYQKTLRLQEARKLLVEGKDIGETAYEVGYESPSQFSREYTRMYGRAPSVDAKRLREIGATTYDISHAPW